MLQQLTPNLSIVNIAEEFLVDCIAYDHSEITNNQHNIWAQGITAMFMQFGDATHGPWTDCQCWSSEG